MILLSRGGPLIARPSPLLAGVPTQLAITTQPTGAADGTPFTGQPVVQIRDANGTVCSTSTANVVAAKASGSGTLSGTTTKAAVDGVATFTDLAITGTGSHTLVFTSTGLASATSSSFNVGGPDLWTPTFISDFRNGTGSDLTDLNDGGKWSVTSLTRAEVIAAGGLGEGWVSTNCLKVRSLEATPDDWYFHAWLDGTLDELAVGETINYRWAFSSHHETAAEGATDNSHHGISDGGGGGATQNWNMTDGTNFVGQWQPSIRAIGLDQFFLGSIVTPTRLTKAVKYTFDVQMHRVSSTTYRIKCWVYDSDGEELYGPSQWLSSSHPGETMASNRAYTFSNAPGTDSFMIGLNGSGSTIATHHSNQGEVAIVRSSVDSALTEGTSIGVYGSAEGET